MNDYEINKKIIDLIRTKYKEEYSNPKDVEFIITQAAIIIALTTIKLPTYITKDDRFHEALNCASLFLKLLKTEFEKIHPESKE